MKKILSIVMAVTMLLSITAIPAFAADRHDGGWHEPVNFYMTDIDVTDAVSVEDGGTGIGANKFFYIGLSEGSGMYSCQYLIDYPEEFISVTNQSNSWSGGLIAQTLASIDDEEQWSDLFDSVCNVTYWGQTGGKPVGEEGNEYINGGCYLQSFSYEGVQAGGVFHRFTMRLDKTPLQSECMHDENGYYLPIGLLMLEFTYGRLDLPGYEGILRASDNYCKPEYAEWFSSTDGKIYVTPAEDPALEPGDVNMDGTVDANDALLALRASLGLVELTAEQFALADIDGNGEITGVDVVTILRTALGLI